MNATMTEDARLQHLCDLSGIAVDMVRNPTFAEEFVAADSGERRDVTACLRILADTCMALMERQGITPALRMPAPATPEETGPRAGGDSAEPDLFDS